MTKPSRSWWCRTNLHHRWETVTTTDGEDYVRCGRCLKERWTGLKGDRSPAANVITNYGSVN